MTAWSSGRLIGFDTESTGVDPLEARIVTAAIVHVQPGQRPTSIQWLLDPGREIPDEAAAVHGWTRTRVLTQTGGEGRAVRIHKGNRLQMTTDGALGEIAGHLAVAMHTETPLVVHNAAYDMTLTEASLARAGVDTLSSRPTGIYGLVDPMVIEKAYDAYRRVKGGCRGGKFDCKTHTPGGCGMTDKTLTSLCAHYGFPHGGAHDAAGDAVAAVRLAVKLAGLWAEVARWKLGTLHAHQITWRKEQSDSLRDYWRRAGDDRWPEVDSSWPLHSRLGQLAGVAS